MKPDLDPDALEKERHTAEIARELYRYTVSMQSDEWRVTDRYAAGEIVARFLSWPPASERAGRLTAIAVMALRDKQLGLVTIPTLTPEEAKAGIKGDGK